MKFVREIDKNGLFVSDAIVTKEQALEDRYIQQVVPEGLLFPMWNGEKWIDSGLKIDKEKGT